MHLFRKDRVTMMIICIFAGAAIMDLVGVEVTVFYFVGALFSAPLGLWLGYKIGVALGLPPDDSA